ncbi:hypothetical protein BDR26DRAFT_1004334 [Obelidium mucronatum]|nr:hypothetical protein BDR26DRAFT_1004334 [Obelidium mucronatum]
MAVKFIAAFLSILVSYTLATRSTKCPDAYTCTSLNPSQNPAVDWTKFCQQTQNGLDFCQLGINNCGCVLHSVIKQSSKAPATKSKTTKTTTKPATSTKKTTKKTTKTTTKKKSSSSTKTHHSTPTKTGNSTTDSVSGLQSATATTTLP